MEYTYKKIFLYIVVPSQKYHSTLVLVKVLVKVYLVEHHQTWSLCVSP